MQVLPPFKAVSRSAHEVVTVAPPGRGRKHAVRFNGTKPAGVEIAGAVIPAIPETLPTESGVFDVSPTALITRVAGWVRLPDAKPAGTLMFKAVGLAGVTLTRLTCPLFATYTLRVTVPTT